MTKADGTYKRARPRLYIVPKSPNSPERISNVSPVHEGALQFLSDVDKIVGNEVARRRIERGMSQKYFCERLGISLDLLRKHENGARRFSPETLSHAAHILELQPSIFFRAVAERLSFDLSVQKSDTAEDCFVAPKREELRERVNDVMERMDHVLRILELANMDGDTN